MLCAQVVEGIARRGDVTIPEFHVFAAPRSSEVFRLIFPEGQPQWPGIVLVVTALAVVAEGIRLAAVSRAALWVRFLAHLHTAERRFAVGVPGRPCPRSEHIKAQA